MIARLQTRLAIAGLLLAAACSEKPYILYDVTAQPPVGDFSATLAMVPVGVVVEFSATIEGSHQNGTMTAAVDNPSRATVTPTTTKGQYVLIGLAVGRTTLRVQVDGEQASSVPIEVSDPPVTTEVDSGVAQEIPMASSGVMVCQ